MSQTANMFVAVLGVIVWAVSTVAIVGIVYLFFKFFRAYTGRYRSEQEEASRRVTEVAVGARVRICVQAEQARQRDKIRAHIAKSTMSVYGSVAETKAARDALQRLLDDEGGEESGEDSNAR